MLWVQAINNYYNYKHILVVFPLCVESRGKACSKDSTHPPGLTDLAGSHKRIPMTHTGITF